MMRTGKMAVCLAGGLALGASLRAANAALPGNPYAPIVARNVFNLNPPPPPTAPVEANPPPKITPNGIMSIFGQWQVLFKTAGVAMPGKPAVDHSYMLAEGERQDDIEVVKIDDKTSVITFNNHGDIQELPLANASGNGSAGSANSTPPPSTFSSPANTFAPNANNVANQFNRFGNPGGNNPGANGGADNGANPQAFQTTGIHTTGQQQPSMSPEDQQIMIAAQHLKAIQDGDPMARIFPPTAVDADAGIPSNTANTPPDSPPSP